MMPQMLGLLLSVLPRRVLQDALMQQWTRTLTYGERIRFEQMGATGNPAHGEFAWADVLPTRAELLERDEAIYTRAAEILGWRHSPADKGWIHEVHKYHFDCPPHDGGYVAQESPRMACFVSGVTTLRGAEGLVRRDAGPGR